MTPNLEGMGERTLDALVAEKVMGLGVKEFWGSDWHIRNPDPNGRAWLDIKNYSSDITAAFEMESEIAKQERHLDYANRLIQIAFNDHMEKGIPNVSYNANNYWLLAHASPKQRVIAALQTFNIEIPKEEI
jgi:hypothetical protein